MRGHEYGCRPSPARTRHGEQGGQPRNRRACELEPPDPSTPNTRNRSANAAPEKVSPDGSNHADDPAPTGARRRMSAPEPCSAETATTHGSTTRTATAAARHGDRRAEAGHVPDRGGRRGRPIRSAAEYGPPAGATAAERPTQDAHGPDRRAGGRDLRRAQPPRAMASMREQETRSAGHAAAGDDPVVGVRHQRVGRRERHRRLPAGAGPGTARTAERRRGSRATSPADEDPRTTVQAAQARVSARPTAARYSAEGRVHERKVGEVVAGRPAGSARAATRGGRRP